MLYFHHQSLQSYTSASCRQEKMYCKTIKTGNSEHQSSITISTELILCLVNDSMLFMYLSHVGAQDAARHHYTKTFRGFSAMLTPSQAKTLTGLHTSECNFCNDWVAKKQLLHFSTSSLTQIGQPLTPAIATNLFF